MDYDYRYWLAIIGAAGWVFHRHKDKPFFERMLVVLASAALGVGAGLELADWAGVRPIGPSALLVIIIWAALDISMTVLADREEVKKAFWKRVGGGK